jgi:ABC-type bacteriocin/lantibiotic exporter with double-glycine peptidase domain
LDEATAHPDSDQERQISQQLQALNLTRISIAHRSGIGDAPDTLLHFVGPEWVVSSAKDAIAIA